MTKSVGPIPFIIRWIVRNKAAEKAKHVHHQQQTSQQSNNNNSIPHGGASVSVITHAPSVGVPHHTSAHHAAAAAAERGTTAYSISGILGIPHPDPNGNIPKRKRDDIHPNLSPGDPPLRPTHIVPKLVLQDRTTGFSSNGSGRRRNLDKSAQGKVAVEGQSEKPEKETSPA
ncbi:hypothetical protein RUM44_004354 [Polyplax serrata]|uniref:Uncharacterized protein n=1 Tax=Polyplax serrata TaxID=468196 RepID=A0ABR1B4F1_POLSC